MTDIAYRVRKYREEAKNGGTPVLYLNAGDTYGGTVWYTLFKHNITSAFLNKLQPDAMVKFGKPKIIHMQRVY